jgi:ubiquinone/menaquinone biosynthesis C-methylase UbiE
MSLLDWACRRYQRLFAVSHPEAEHLAALHSTREDDSFLQAYFDHEYAKGQKTLERFSTLNRDWPGGGRGLDFGCGAGGLTYRLREVCDEAVGIDLEEHKLAFARTQAGRLTLDRTSFVCYDGSRVPFPDAHFRLILCVDVLEHVPDPAFAMKELARLLEPGGWLLLAFGPPWYHAHGKHMWVKLPGWWTHLIFPRGTVMKLAGFPPATTWPDLGIQRLSVGKFEKARAASGLTPLLEQRHSKAMFAMFKAIPGLRELFISEVIGIYRKIC